MREKICMWMIIGGVAGALLGWLQRDEQIIKGLRLQLEVCSENHIVK